MLQKIKLKNKTAFGISISCLIMFTFFLNLSSVVRADALYSDPLDDVKCFTDEQIASFEDMYDEPESAEDLHEILRDIWPQGVTSATPDCIDMKLIAIREVGMNYELTIYVEGELDNCDPINIYIWGNCSGGSFVVAGIIETGSGGSSGQYWYRDSDGNRTTGSIDLGSSSFEMTFPKTQSDCSLNILLVHDNCADIYPNCFFGQDSSSAPDSTSNADDSCSTCNDDDLESSYDMILSFLSYFILIAIIIFIILMGTRKK